jgi:hypothetical protein
MSTRKKLGRKKLGRKKLGRKKLTRKKSFRKKSFRKKAGMQKQQQQQQQQSVIQLKEVNDALALINTKPKDKSTNASIDSASSGIPEFESINTKRKHESLSSQLRSMPSGLSKTLLQLEQGEMPSRDRRVSNESTDSPPRSRQK